MMRKFFSLLCLFCLFAFFSSFIPYDLFLQYIVRTKSSFGEPNAQVEVYFFDDWSKALTEDQQKVFYQIAEQALGKAQLNFIEGGNPETQNESRLNLQMLLNENKELSTYLKARSNLHALMQRKDPPQRDELEMVAKALDIPMGDISQDYQKASYALAQSVYKAQNIEKTPCVIVYDNATKKQVRIDELTQNSVKEVLETIEKWKMAEQGQKSGL
jgi:hypothetical protein